MLLLEHRGKFVDTKKLSLDKLVLERFVEEGIKSENTDLARASSRAKKILSRMEQVFENRDQLLTSQGLIRLYYWMVRTMGGKKELRDFLLAFERERKHNRRIAKESPDHADQQLLSFDILNRSPDDQASYVKRFEILGARYAEFVGARSGTSPKSEPQTTRA